MGLYCNVKYSGFINHQINQFNYATSRDLFVIECKRWMRLSAWNRGNHSAYCGNIQGCDVSDGTSKCMYARTDGGEARGHWKQIFWKETASIWSWSAKVEEVQRRCSCFSALPMGREAGTSLLLSFHHGSCSLQVVACSRAEQLAWNPDLASYLLANGISQATSLQVGWVW